MNTGLITYSDKTALNENGSIADVNKVKATDMNEVKAAINTGLVNLIYPIGALFLTTSNVNPSTYLGGTWEQVKDRFLLGAGDTYSSGATGGEATHVLTISEMPSHNHLGIKHYQSNASSTGYSTSWSEQLYESIGTDYTGGGQAHNNMPPYLVIYIWKRTA